MLVCCLNFNPRQYYIQRPHTLSAQGSFRPRKRDYTHGWIISHVQGIFFNCLHKRIIELSPVIIIKYQAHHIRRSDLHGYGSNKGPLVK